MIYSFPCCVDGPVGPLAKSGSNFYVATSSSIYKVTAAGVGSVLYTFPANTHPDGQLTIDSAGNLYVANHGNSTVTVYAPGARRPFETISEGVKAPLALLVGR